MNRTAFDWDLTSKINRIAGMPFPWLTKLEEIGTAILQSCESDAIWILTLPPLRVAASGLLRTPLALEPSAVIVVSDASPPISKNWPPDHSLLSRVIKTGQPQFGTHLLKNGNGVDHDLGDVLFHFDEIDVQALIPIGIEEDCYGVMIIGNRPGKSPLSEPVAQMLLYMGQHLALTLQNASLIETAQHQSRQLAILNRIARTVTSSLDLDEVLQLTMSGVDEILDVEAGAILLLDEKANDLYFKILLRGAENIPTDLRLQIGEGIAGWVFQNQKPALVNDVRRDSRFSERVDSATGFITSSVLCTPLVVNGRTIGSVEVLNKQRDIFTLDDQVLFTSMTASLAVALHNSILYQQMQDRPSHARYSTDGRHSACKWIQADVRP
jgi:GAF domain-containing protein